MQVWFALVLAQISASSLFPIGKALFHRFLGTYNNADCTTVTIKLGLLKTRLLNFNIGI